MRSPYGRGGVYGTMARLFAERGYHAVVQSCRGTFGSEGRIDFDREAADGRAAADWIIGQPWSDGTIGTFGGSYLTFTQLALASTRPPQLKAMALGIWAAERRAYTYPGGAFSLDRLGWAFTIENQERPLAFLRTPLRIKKDLGPAFNHLPLINADTAAVGHPVGYYRDWLTHDQPGDPYWTPTDFRPILPDLGVPVTMISRLVRHVPAVHARGLPAAARRRPDRPAAGRRVAPHQPGPLPARVRRRPRLVRDAPPEQRARAVPRPRPENPRRDHGRRRLARAARVAPAGRRPALAPPARRRPGHQGTARLRPRPLHLRPRRSHPRRRRHQHDHLRPGRQPRARAAPRRADLHDPGANRADRDHRRGQGRALRRLIPAAQRLLRPPVRRRREGDVGQHHRRHPPPDRRDRRPAARHRRPVADRPPLRGLPPHPPPGLVGRPSPLRPQPRIGRAPGDRDDPARAAAVRPSRPAPPLRDPAARDRECTGNEKQEIQIRYIERTLAPPNSQT